MPDEATIPVEEANDRPSTHRRLTIDLASSYALSLARVASMAAIVAILYRYCGPKLTGIFVLVRTMAGVLNYAFAGIGPATQLEIAASDASARDVVAEAFGDARERFVSYRSMLATATPASDSACTPYVSARFVTLAATVVAAACVAAYAANFNAIHDYGPPISADVESLALVFGMGTLARLLAEPASAALQSRGWLALDNGIVIVAELAWPWFVWTYATDVHPGPTILLQAGSCYGVAGVLGTLSRLLVARLAIGTPQTMREGFDCDVPTTTAIARRAAATSAGSFADFLYAPFNLALINAALGPISVADYTPALQFDGALLLLVSSIASVVLPRAMRSASEGRREALRTLYVRSTLSSLGMLASAAMTLVLMAPIILRVWLGQPMPVTLSILPFVLIHTVVGGTAGVGRAVLLGMGRFRAYTISALVGGVANVALALLFVLGFGWGLRGVVFATIVAVVGRCAIWMPWYILRALRAPAIAQHSGALRP